MKKMVASTEKVGSICRDIDGYVVESIILTLTNYIACLKWWEVLPILHLEKKKDYTSVFFNSFIVMIQGRLVYRDNAYMVFLKDCNFIYNQMNSWPHLFLYVEISLSVCRISNSFVIILNCFDWSEWKKQCVHVHVRHKLPKIHWNPLTFSIIV